MDRSRISWVRCLSLLDLWDCEDQKRVPAKHKERQGNTDYGSHTNRSHQQEDFSNDFRFEKKGNWKKDGNKKSTEKKQFQKLKNPQCGWQLKLKLKLSLLVSALMGSITVTDPIRSELMM